MRAGATWGGGGGTLHESLGSEAHRSNDIEVTRAGRFPDSWKGRDTKVKICLHILTFRICHATSWGWACARSLSTCWGCPGKTPERVGDDIPLRDRHRQICVVQGDGQAARPENLPRLLGRHNGLGRGANCDKGHCSGNDRLARRSSSRQIFDDSPGQPTRGASIYDT